MGSFLSIIIICAISSVSSSTSIQLFSEEGIIHGRDFIIIKSNDHGQYFILFKTCSSTGVNVLDGIYIYYIPPPLTVHFSMTRSVRYQPILHTLYYTLHTEHAYCLSYRILNNVVITTVIEMVEMVEILDGRLGKRSVGRVRYVINKVCNKQFITLGYCEIWRHFTRTLYFYSPSARDNTVATLEISRHITR